MYSAGVVVEHLPTQVYSLSYKIQSTTCKIGGKTKDVFIFNTVWTKHQRTLKDIRYAHRSFVAGNTIFHFGGKYGDGEALRG